MLGTNQTAVSKQKMTVSNVKLGINQSTTTYGPLGYGSHAGVPVVDFSVSEAEQKKMKVQSVESIMENNNWKRVVSSGFARLQFNGKNAFKEEHEVPISEFARLLDARFVDFEVSKNELQQRPPRMIENLADYYRVFVPSNRDFDSEVFEYFSEQARSFGNVEFIFKVDSYGDDRYVKEISREYQIYDSDIWLYPRGRKAKTVSERMRLARKMAKSNTWNLSPRMGILMDAREEIVDDE